MIRTALDGAPLRSIQSTASPWKDLAWMPLARATHERVARPVGSCSNGVVSSGLPPSELHQTRNQTRKIGGKREKCVQSILSFLLIARGRRQPPPPIFCPQPSVRHQ